MCFVNADAATVEFLAAGTCIVTANQAGNEDYNAAAPVQANILADASKESQTLSFNPEELVNLGTEPQTLSAVASSGLTEIQFEAVGKPVNACELNGTSLAYKAEGVCTVTAKQAGDALYSPAESVVKIMMASPTAFSLQILNQNNEPVASATEDDVLKISVLLKANALDVNKIAKLYLTATAGDLSFMWTTAGLQAASDPLRERSIVMLPANELSTLLYEGKLLTGSYSIYAAYVTEDGHKTEVGSLFTVKRKQAITFNDIPKSELFDGKRVTLNIQGGESTNPVRLTTATSDVCRLNDRTVRFIAQGECVLQAEQDGNEVFADVLVTKRFAIKSAGVFSVYANTFDNEMDITLDLQAPTDDVGKPALLYLKIGSASKTWILTKDGWAALDQRTGWRPVSDTRTVLLASLQSVLLYKGVIPAGNYTLAMAYETADGNRTTATSTINVPEGRLCTISRGTVTLYSGYLAKLSDELRKLAVLYGALSKDMELERSMYRKQIKILSDHKPDYQEKQRAAEKEVQMYCIN